jgi:hypothetical protein
MKSVTFSCIRAYGMTTKNVRHTNYIGTSISKYMSSTRGWCDGSDMSDRATTTLLHQHNEGRQSHWRPSSATHRNRRTSYNFTIVTRSLKCHCLKPNLWWTSIRRTNCVQAAFVSLFRVSGDSQWVPNHGCGSTGTSPHFRFLETILFLSSTIIDWL